MKFLGGTPFRNANNFNMHGFGLQGMPDYDKTKTKNTFRNF